MIKLDIPFQMVNWIMSCVRTMSYSVFVNGKPLPPFKAMKGLRQGDPLSPFLFAMSMEYFTRYLNRSEKRQEFGFHPKCRRTGTIGFLFVDDLLIFCKANLDYVTLVIEHIDKLSASSSLFANSDKFSFHSSGIHIDLQHNLAG